MIQFLNTYMEIDREEKTNRILEERCICEKTGRIIEREITRYYPDCDRLIHYVRYSHGMEVLSFYNNSNEKAVRIELIKREDGYRCERTVYGSQYVVEDIDAEGRKLINQVLNKVKNDKFVDFQKIYDDF